MSIVMKLQHLSRLAAVSILLPLLCACYNYDTYTDTDADNNNGTAMPPQQMATANHYINLTITVSTGSGSTTRAPKGGEDGDGREAGFARENFVAGITLMLYEDAVGINTSAAETPLAFVGYFPVTLVARPGERYNTEATYTTGNYSLENSGLDLSKSYHAIVVANADLTNLDNPIKVGDKLSAVRDHKLTKIYDGDGQKANAENFVMSLEQECTIDFTASSNKTTTTNGKTYYTFDDIYIERLAARIDFWAKNATYDETKGGYEYNVKNSTDKFVLTAVTPFNLYDNEKASEYLFKRLGDKDGNNISYLAEEPGDYNADDQSLYVLDPNTLTKTPPSDPSAPFIPLYMNSSFALSAIMENNTQQMPMTDFQSTKYRHTEDGSEADNIIVCYPKENTLLTTSPLYYYATGLCIEGDYYKGSTGESTHYVYYGYLRHQGESDGSYSITETLDKDERGAFPMNFGVVRNNIYRIFIEEIAPKTTEDEPSIKLQIKVKKWDTFTHDIIYM